jgi:uncharacterized protein (DUF2336 family)
MIAVLRRATPQDRRRKIGLLAQVVGFTPAETRQLIDNPEMLYRALLEASSPTSR